MATDPVCGKDVSEQNWLANGSFRRFMGERPYYFCSLACRRQFSGNPAEYLVRRAGGTVTAPFALPTSYDDTTTTPEKLSLEKIDTNPISPLNPENDPTETIATTDAKRSDTPSDLEFEVLEDDSPDASDPLAVKVEDPGLEAPNPIETDAPPKEKSRRQTKDKSPLPPMRDA